MKDEKEAQSTRFTFLYYGLRKDGAYKCGMSFRGFEGVLFSCIFNLRNMIAIAREEAGEKLSTRVRELRRTIPLEIRISTVEESTLELDDDQYLFFLRTALLGFETCVLLLPRKTAVTKENIRLTIKKMNATFGKMDFLGEVEVITIALDMRVPKRTDVEEFVSGIYREMRSRAH